MQRADNTAGTNRILSAVAMVTLWLAGAAGSFAADAPAADKAFSISGTAPWLIHVARWKFDEKSGTTAADAWGNVPGTLVGDPTWEAGRHGGALRLNGKGQYVDTKWNLEGLALPCTFAFWVNPAATQCESADIFGNIEGSQYGMVMQQNGPAHNLYTFFYGLSSTGPVQLTANEWQHVAVVCDGKEVIIYLNGKEAARGKGVNPITPNPNLNFRLGSGFAGGRFFNGALDDFRIYGRALSAADVQAMMDDDDKGATAPKPSIAFIFVGHSVMRGDGRETVPDQEGLDIWDFDNGRGIWRRFVSKGAAAEGQGTGPAKPFLQELAKAYPECRFGAIRVCRNGIRAADYQKNTDMFRTIVQSVKEARRQGFVIGGVASCLGWMEQVIASRDKATATAFEENYLRFIDDLRAAIEAPELPVFASQIEGRLYPPLKDESATLFWLDIFYSSLPGQREQLAVISVEGIPTSDTHHFTTEGDALWGKRALAFAQQLKVVEQAKALWVKQPLVQPALEGAGLPKAAPMDEKAPTLAVVRAKLLRHTKPLKNAEYKHRLVVSEYEIVQVLEGRLDEPKIIVIQHSIRDRKPTPAFDYKLGEIHRLALTPWRTQSKLHSEALDDDIVDLEREWYFARGCARE
jgi:hypothetical protein